MTTRKRGLGKGLSALIGDKPLVETLLSEDLKDTKENIYEIDISLIYPQENQPRQNFDESTLKELSNSIEAHGVLQPIILRKVDEKYEIVAGERRWRASQLIGKTTIPSIIREMDDETVSKIALIENIQREDLNPIEEALAYKRLMKEFDLTQEQISNVVGKSRSYITNSMRLLNLDKPIIEYIKNGDLTSGHGKALLGIKDKGQQLKAAEKIINTGLNVRETEEIVKKQRKPGKRPKSRKDSFLIELEEDLMEALGTKVNLVLGNKRNKIEIEYYGEEDLERIVEHLIR